MGSVKRVASNTALLLAYGTALLLYSLVFTAGTRPDMVGQRPTGTVMSWNGA